MSKNASEIEEIPNPQAVYLRRAGVLAPAELVVACEGRLIVCRIPDDWLLRIIADGAHFLATRIKTPAP